MKKPTRPRNKLKLDQLILNWLEGKEDNRVRSINTLPSSITVPQLARQIDRHIYAVHRALKKLEAKGKVKIMRRRGPGGALVMLR